MIVWPSAIWRSILLTAQKKAAPSWKCHKLRVSADSRSLVWGENKSPNNQQSTGSCVCVFFFFFDWGSGSYNCSNAQCPLHFRDLHAPRTMLSPPPDSAAQLSSLSLPSPAVGLAIAPHPQSFPDQAPGWCFYILLDLLDWIIFSLLILHAQWAGLCWHTGHAGI